MNVMVDDDWWRMKCHEEREQSFLVALVMPRQNASPVLAALLEVVLSMYSTSDHVFLHLHETMPSLLESV
jgi:hypothetical protein